MLRVGFPDPPYNFADASCQGGSPRGGIFGIGLTSLLRQAAEGGSAEGGISGSA